MVRVFIGTSGWHYKHWRGSFYPDDLPIGAWFDYYQERLDSVEINNSFYRLLDAEVVSRWVKQTARGFVFAVKGSRYITYNKGALLSRDAVEREDRRKNEIGLRECECATDIDAAAVRVRVPNLRE